MLPYFIRAEDNQDPDIAYNGFHGRGGPLTVQRSKMVSPLAYTFVEAGKQFGMHTHIDNLYIVVVKLNTNEIFFLFYGQTNITFIQMGSIQFGL